MCSDPYVLEPITKAIFYSVATFGLGTLILLRYDIGGMGSIFRDKRDNPAEGISQV